MDRANSVRAETGHRMDAVNSEPRRQHSSVRAYVNESKLRVVIVEDSAIIRARLAETLSEIPNLEIIGQTESEAGALSLLTDKKWDAVVLDLQLKEGTGLGVLKKLRQQGRPVHTTVIVFTNYSFPQYRDRSLSFGADFFFDKAREFHRVRDVLEELAAGGTPPPALSS